MLCCEDGCSKNRWKGRRCYRHQRLRTGKPGVCVVCGGQFLGDADTQQTCSNACDRKRRRIGQCSPLNWRTCRRCGDGWIAPRGLAPALCTLCREAEERRPIRTIKCEVCRKKIVSNNPKRRFCSELCKHRSYRRLPLRRAKRAAWARSRQLRQKVATVDFVLPHDVFVRDGWRCQECGVKTLAELRGKARPKAPEVDHILPIALGGEHSMLNVQTLCRRCNGAKGARARGQMRLMV